MSDLHHLGSVSLLENFDDMVSHLEQSLAAKNLTATQKIQVLRDLMADDIGANRVFQDACQSIISRLHHGMTNIPTISIANAHVLLNNSTVLSRLQVEPLQAVVGGDIAFRISCLEVLRGLGRMDLLFKQIGHLTHWREGQTMIQIITSKATPDQLSRVFMEFVHNRFSNYTDRSFGPDIYREEFIDMLFSAVISRATVEELYVIAAEFQKGAAAIGLPPEQFDRYTSVVTVKITASQMRDELSGLVDVPSLPDMQSSAFWATSLPPQNPVTASGVFTPPGPSLSDVNPPTRVDRRFPPNIPHFAPASPSTVPPPRRDESAAFGSDEDNS